MPLETQAVPTNTGSRGTIPLKQMAAELAETNGSHKKRAEEVVGDLMASATRHRRNGDKIRLAGLGMLPVRSLPAWAGRNPGTGEVIQIKAMEAIAFHTALVFPASP